MKVLIVSDTHGINDELFRVLKIEGEPDFLIHAGDIDGSEEIIRNSVKCPVKMVKGNNDFGSELNREEQFMVGNLSVFLTHGHYDGVYYGADKIFYKAASRNANIAIFGHTHVPYKAYDEELGIWAVNPGSLTYPRQAGGKYSYMVMEIDGEGKPSFAIKYL